MAQGPLNFSGNLEGNLGDQGRSQVGSHKDKDTNNGDFPWNGLDVSQAVGYGNSGKGQDGGGDGKEIHCIDVVNGLGKNKAEDQAQDRHPAQDGEVVQKLDVEVVQGKFQTQGQAGKEDQDQEANKGVAGNGQGVGVFDSLDPLGKEDQTNA